MLDKGGIRSDVRGNLPERVARRISVPHHQIGSTVFGLRSGYVKLEYRHPYLVSGTTAGTGLAIYRISGGRKTGWRGL